jgi:hypothetical protein
VTGACDGVAALAMAGGSSNSIRTLGAGNDLLVGEEATEAVVGEVAAEDGEAIGDGLMRLGSEI